MTSDGDSAMDAPATSDLDRLVGVHSCEVREMPGRPVIREGGYWWRATVCLLVFGIVSALVFTFVASQARDEAKTREIDALREQLAENDDQAICRSAVAAAVNDADAEADIAKAEQASAFDALAAAVITRPPPDALLSVQDRLNAASAALAAAARHYREAVDVQQATIARQRNGSFTSCPL